MSVRFSNTHLRVPRGFGSVLEGLAREVLRDQPGNIPQYAARYFHALLKQREESGVDPAEWAAKLEERFYYNQAFKTGETDPEEETVTDVAASREETYESQAEDESSVSTEAQNLSAALPHLTESEDEDGQQNPIEKNTFSVETGHSDGESVNRLPTTDLQSAEASSMGQQAEPGDQVVHEGDGPAGGRRPPQRESHSPDSLSFKGLGAAEDGGAPAVVDTESEQSDNGGVGEPAQIFPHSGRADMDVCASELERAPEGIQDIKSIKAQPEGTVGQTSLSLTEKADPGQQEVEDRQAEKGEEEKPEIELPSEQTHESSSLVGPDLDCNASLQEDSLVEVNFEDIPEAQLIAPQITEVEEVGTTELEQTETLRTEHLEEPKELNPSGIQTHQNTSDAQEYHDFKSGGVKKEVDSQEEESLLDSTEIEENVATNDPDPIGINTENISTSHLHTAEAEEGAAQEMEDNETVNQGKFQRRDDSGKETEFKGDEKTDTLEADEEEIYKEGHTEMEDEEINDAGAGNNSSQVTHWSTSVAPTEPESEMFDESAQDLTEEDGERERALGEPQPGDAKKIKDAASKEVQQISQKESDSEAREKSEESASLWTTADQQDVEKLPESEKQPSQPAGESQDQEECSRPQEEEDIMDIPLDDPEANRAAAKIQAGFRGHMTRKKMKPEDKAEGEERQEDRGQ